MSPVFTVIGPLRSVMRSSQKIKEKITSIKNMLNNMEMDWLTSTLAPSFLPNKRQGGRVGPRKIQIVTTGGTIEKVYDEEEGLLTNKTPNVEKSHLIKITSPLYSRHLSSPDE